MVEPSFLVGIAVVFVVALAFISQIKYSPLIGLRVHLINMTRLGKTVILDNLWIHDCKIERSEQR